MKCLLKSQDVVTDGNSFFSGYFFRGLRLYRGEEAFSLLEERLAEGNVREELRSFSGSFYYVHTNGAGGSILVTDQVRSRPLFISHDAEGEMILSDVYGLPELYGRGEEMDEGAAMQVRTLGYVVGKNTLLKNFRQVTAGSIVEVCRDEVVGEECYLDFFTPETADKDVLCKQLLAAYDRAFERTIAYLGGRQALVPLSGGIDSRFVLLGLVKKGYKNVLAYTYGKDVSGEALISQKVAEAVNVRWEFVPYVPKQMRKLHSEKMGGIARIAGNVSSLPIVSGWYALSCLKQNGVIEEGAVNLMGHSAASIGEELTRKELPGEGTISKNRMVESYMEIAAMFTKETLPHRDGIIARLCEEVTEKESELEWKDAYTWMKRLYYFGRHANYLLNTVKVEESLGLDWYCPLVDREVHSIWNTSVPREFADSRRLYREVIREYCGNQEGMPNSSSDLEGAEPVKKAGWKRFLQEKFKNSYGIYLAARKLGNFDRNIQGYYSKRELYRAILNGTLHIDTLEADRFLKWFRTERVTSVC